LWISGRCPGDPHRRRPDHARCARDRGRGYRVCQADGRGAYAHPDCYASADRDADRDLDRNADRDADADGYLNRYTDANCYAHADCYAHANCYAYAGLVRRHDHHG
jgi:hypothetical protein